MYKTSHLVDYSLIEFDLGILTLLLKRIWP